jgi:hypothetical protein
MKLKFLFLFFVLFFTNNLLFANENNIYGTWVARIYGENELITSRITFTKTRYYVIIKVFENCTLLDTEGISAIIISWYEEINTDNETKDMFPNGYRINFHADENYNGFDIFISNDKLQIIIPELNEELDQIVIFTRE